MGDSNCATWTRRLRLMRMVACVSGGTPSPLKARSLATHTRMQRPGVPLPGQLTARDSSRRRVATVVWLSGAWRQTRCHQMRLRWHQTMTASTDASTHAAVLLMATPQSNAQRNLTRARSFVWRKKGATRTTHPYSRGSEQSSPRRGRQPKI